MKILPHDSLLTAANKTICFSNQRCFTRGWFSDHNPWAATTTQTTHADVANIADRSNNNSVVTGNESPSLANSSSRRSTGPTLTTTSTTATTYSSSYNWVYPFHDSNVALGAMTLSLSAMLLEVAL